MLYSIWNSLDVVVGRHAIARAVVAAFEAFSDVAIEELVEEVWCVWRWVVCGCNCRSDAL